MPGASRDNLHYVGYCLLGWTCNTDPAEHLRAAGSDLDHLIRDLLNV